MDSKFKNDVYDLVGSIPKGKVMTYGQIALLCGHPGAARVVGQIAHFGPNELPWHRVVKKDGVMASGFTPDGRKGQARLLKEDGIKVYQDKLKVEDYLWLPSR